MRIPLSERPLAIIIEDDPKQATIFTGALTMAGYEIRNFADGREAVKYLHNTLPPALVLLDLHLPEVAGDKVLHYLRLEPRFAETIVIIATADSSMAASLEDNADYILQKPISFTQLRDLAERLRGAPK
ncbi:MAG: response regulator [Anaerolineales bacterium]